MKTAIARDYQISDRRFSLISNRGFSLIELIVAVGIIGMLASIAMPQFLRFQAKSRQIEAKKTLGTIFTLETAFFTEWSTYTTNLGTLGFGVEGNRVRYNAGFTQTSCTNYPVGVAPNENNTNNLLTIVDPSVAFAFAPIPLTPPVAPTPTTTFCDKDSFQAAAFGNPANDPTTTNGADGWTIDNQKLLRNSTQGF